MTTLNLSVTTENKQTIFSTFTPAPTISQKQIIHSPWIKNNKPAYFSINENIYPLQYIVSKNNREILTIKGTIENYFFLVVFTYGNDPARPSFRGTITLTAREIA